MSPLILTCVSEATGVTTMCCRIPVRSGNN